MTAYPSSGQPCHLRAALDSCLKDAQNLIEGTDDAKHFLNFVVNLGAAGPALHHIGLKRSDLLGNEEDLKVKIKEHGPV